jgi:SAM-dependent methyltransferase
MDRAIYQRMRELEDCHWWFAGRRNIVQHVLSSLDLSKDLSKPRAILEAGCGTGGNLPLLARFGDVTGIEADDEALALARGRGVCEVLKGHLPDGMPFTDERFDLIALIDVLEHIEDDIGSLTALGTLLTPGGYLVMTVPAFQFLWSRHDEEHHHKRRYTASSLQQVVEQAGLRIERLTYYNTWLFPIVAAARLAEKLMPPGDVGHDLRLPNARINALLEAVFSSERHLVNRVRMPFGISLLAILRRPGSGR